MLRSWHYAVGALLAGMLAAGPAVAGDADVVGVKVTAAGTGFYDFAVTVQSADIGWERYADRLEAVGPDGSVLGTRDLAHPHDDEQPFTRSITGVAIAEPVAVTIRAHFKPTGFNGDTKVVALPKDVP